MSDSLNLEELKHLILDQQQKIDKLEHRVNLAEKQAEAAEQHSRQYCLILRGKIDIRPNCSIRDEVMRIITFHTGVRFPQLVSEHSTLVRGRHKYHRALQQQSCEGWGVQEQGPKRGRKEGPVHTRVPYCLKNGSGCQMYCAPKPRTHHNLLHTKWKCSGEENKKFTKLAHHSRHDNWKHHYKTTKPTKHIQRGCSTGWAQGGGHQH